MLQSILAFIFVIGVLVFIHELGHFLAARRVGIRVLTFALGFGPKLLSFRRGDTEYCVCALPLGGYVKMAGESADDKRTGADDEFMSKTKWERFQVLIMGPVMNLVLAVVVMTFVLYQGAEVPDYEDAPPVVGTIVEGSVAEGAGVQVGDRIVSVDGSAVETWRQVFVEALPRAGQELSVEIRTETGRTRTVMMTPDSEATSMAAVLGVGPVMEPQIRAVTAGEPADLAGVLAGDVIEALEGTPVSSEELVAFINGSAGESLELTGRRDGVQRSIHVIPALVGDVGLIGVALHPYVTRVIEPGFGEAFTLSLERNYEQASAIFQTLTGLFTARTSPRQLAGPIGIAQMSAGAAALGASELFAFMSFLSLNLGILNLLPVPVLDGGHIAIMALEGVSRRDFSTRMKERMLLIGFALLMTLMVTVIYNDLTRVSWIERLMPWR